MFFICLPFRTFQVSKVPQDRFKQKRSFFFSHPLVCEKCSWNTSVASERGNWENASGLKNTYENCGNLLWQQLFIWAGVWSWQGDWICLRNVSKGNEWDSEEQAAKKLRMTLLQNCGFKCGIYFLILPENCLGTSTSSIWYRVLQLQKVLVLRVLNFVSMSQNITDFYHFLRKS